MKNFRLVALLFAASSTLASCTKSDTDTNMGNDVIVTANATTLEPSTRMGYHEDATLMSFTWENQGAEKEAFSAFVDGDNTPVTFELTNGSGTKNGTFAAKFNPTPAVGRAVYAIYPKLESQTAYDATQIDLDLSEQTLATTTEQLKHNKLHYMWSAGTYTAENDVNFKFTHKVAILKVEMTLPATAGNIKLVKLSGPRFSATLNATTGDLNFSNNEVTETVITATQTDGVALVNGKLTAYVYLLPQPDNNWPGITIKAIDANGKLYATEIANRNIEAGNVYTVAKTLDAAPQLNEGDFYMSDGTIITKDVTSLADFTTKKCSGIVFWIDANGAKKGKIVSLDEKTTEWSVISEETKATDIDDGAANTAKVFALATYQAAKSYYPAFEWCETKNTPIVQGLNWYIPARSELKYLLDDQLIVTLNTSLAAADATVLGGSFWSSTERNNSEAWNVHAYDHVSSNFEKSKSFNVRVISAF